jgi:DNA-binding transcriptional LysR family regulator
LALRPSVSVEALLGADLILREEGSGTRTVMEAALQRAGYAIDPARIVMASSSLRAILAMIRHNLGVSVLSRAVADDPGTEAPIRFIPVEGLSLKYDIFLLTRVMEDLTESARAMVEGLRESRINGRPRH